LPLSKRSIAVMLSVSISELDKLPLSGVYMNFKITHMIIVWKYGQNV
jgi:hypothetical protein